MMSYNDIKKNEEIKAYIEQGDKVLSTMGYTEHCYAHAAKVALCASDLLRQLGFPNDKRELAAIAGYMHDIGNTINRINHAQSGAVMAFNILRDLNMPPKDVATIVSAIGNHDEQASSPPDEIAAAVILADKSDVRKSRVRNQDKTTFDIHDRVNYAAEDSVLSLNKETRVITLDIKIDTEICSTMDYFEIFLNRMLLCRKAADVLKLKLEIIINGYKML